MVELYQEMIPGQFPGLTLQKLPSPFKTSAVISEFDSLLINQVLAIPFHWGGGMGGIYQCIVDNVNLSVRKTWCNQG